MQFCVAILNGVKIQPILQKPVLVGFLNAPIHTQRSHLEMPMFGGGGGDYWCADIVVNCKGRTLTRQCERNHETLINMDHMKASSCSDWWLCEGCVCVRACGSREQAIYEDRWKGGSSFKIKSKFSNLDKRKATYPIWRNLKMPVIHIPKTLTILTLKLIILEWYQPPLSECQVYTWSQTIAHT